MWVEEERDDALTCQWCSKFGHVNQPRTLCQCQCMSHRQAESNQSNLNHCQNKNQHQHVNQYTFRNNQHQNMSQCMCQRTQHQNLNQCRCQQGKGSYRGQQAFLHCKKRVACVCVCITSLRIRCRPRLRLAGSMPCPPLHLPPSVALSWILLEPWSPVPSRSSHLVLSVASVLFRAFFGPVTHSTAVVARTLHISSGPLPAGCSSPVVVVPVGSSPRVRRPCSEMPHHGERGFVAVTLHFLVLHLVGFPLKPLSVRCMTSDLCQTGIFDPHAAFVNCFGDLRKQPVSECIDEALFPWAGNSGNLCRWCHP